MTISENNEHEKFRPILLSLTTDLGLKIIQSGIKSFTSSGLNFVDVMKNKLSLSHIYRGLLSIHMKF